MLHSEMHNGRFSFLPPKNGGRVIASGTLSAKSYKTLPDGIVEVYDLDFAAYCCMRDLPFADAVTISKRPPWRYKINFYDQHGKIAQLAADFMNSESANFADHVRRLKKVTRSYGE